MKGRQGNLRPLVHLLQQRFGASIHYHAMYHCIVYQCLPHGKVRRSWTYTVDLSSNNSSDSCGNGSDCFIFAARTWNLKSFHTNRGWNYSAPSQPNHNHREPTIVQGWHTLCWHFSDYSRSGDWNFRTVGLLSLHWRRVERRLLVSRNEVPLDIRDICWDGSCSTPKSGRSSFQNASELLFELIWTNKVL